VNVSPSALRFCRRFASCFVLSSAVLAAAPASAQTASAPAPAAQPWMDTSLSPDQRADALLSATNEDEELSLVRGYFGANIDFSFTRPVPPEFKSSLPGTAGYVPGIPRLGVPALIESDAGVGIANSLHMRPGDTATAFPSTLATAASFDPEVAFAIGSAIGGEASARGYNVVLDGSLNLGREPRGGRTFEYAGEDPLLAGTIAGEVVRGIQSRHVISTVKHYALNDQETGRQTLSVDMPEGAMRESDLLAFEIAIEHGRPGAVMCAYNRVGGVYACENDFLLNHVLKHDWNYPGWVLSDWGGVHSTIAAANGGLDQQSAARFDSQDFFGAPLKEAIASGKVDPARLHDMVHRILRSMFAMGLFDNPAVKTAPPLADSAAVARRDASESIVLLKNAGNLLPLSGNIRSIAVIGPHADVGMLSGGGSSQVIPLGDGKTAEFASDGPSPPVSAKGGSLAIPRYVYDPPSPLSAIAALAPTAAIRFADTSDINAALNAARGADIAIVFATQWMTETQDVPSLSLPRGQDALIAEIAAANPRTIVVLETGGPVLMPWLDSVGAVLEAWYAGNDGAPALADILFGNVDPSGRLPITFPKSEDQLPNPQLPGRGEKGPFTVTYPEGADAGYRWFEKQKGVPLFPFGFGLSYTSFVCSGLDIEAGETIVATVDVTNKGGRAGRDVVQLYATPPQGVSRLVGFASVTLAAGETKRVTIPAEPRLLGTFDADAQTWRIAKGDYAVAVGASAAEPGETKTVTLEAREMKP